MMHSFLEKLINAYWLPLLEPYPFLHLDPPLLLWYVALFLIVLFTVSFSCLYWQTFWFKRTLRLATQRINAVPPAGRPLDGAGIEELGRIMSTSPVLKEQWDEFEETLIRETGPNGESRVFNSVQADEYLGEHATIDRKIWTRYFSAVPGLLTGIGLLFTFVAILIGLHGVTVDGHIQEHAIENLIGGLSGKFITSIVALLGATIFVFVERWVFGGLRQVHHRFISTINRRLARRSAEIVLQDLYENVREQTICFKRFDTDLGNTLKNSVQESLNPLIERVAGALDKLATERGENKHEMMESIMKDFRSSLMGAASGQFDSLAQSVQATADLLQSLNTQSMTANSRTETLLTQLDEFIQRQGQVSTEQLSSLAASMQEATNNFREVISRSSESMATSVQGVLSQLEQTSKRQLEELQIQNGRLSELFADLSKTTQESASSSASSMLSSLNAVLDRIDRSNSEQARSAETQKEQLQSLFAVMSERMKEMMSDSSTSVKESVAGVLENTSTWTTSVTERLATLLEDHKTASVTFESAHRVLNDALDSFASVVNGASGTLGQLSGTTHTLKDVSNTLSDAIQRLNQANDTWRVLLSRSDEARGGVEGLLGKQAANTEAFERVFSQLDQNLGRVLQQIGQSVDNYRTAIKSALETTLQEFDKQMSTATNRLGVTVKQLATSIETLEDLIPPHLQNGGAQAKQANA